MNTTCSFAHLSRPLAAFNPDVLIGFFSGFSNSLREAQSCTWNLRPAFVMTLVNDKGFDMNPTKEAVKAGLRDCDRAVFAMKVLGGGAYASLLSISHRVAPSCGGNDT
jgi:hypothetical protein